MRFLFGLLFIFSTQLHATKCWNDADIDEILTDRVVTAIRASREILPVNIDPSFAAMEGPLARGIVGAGLEKHLEEYSDAWNCPIFVRFLKNTAARLETFDLAEVDQAADEVQITPDDLEAIKNSRIALKRVALLFPKIPAGFPIPQSTPYDYPKFSADWATWSPLVRTCVLSSMANAKLFTSEIEIINLALHSIESPELVGLVSSLFAEFAEMTGNSKVSLEQYGKGGPPPEPPPSAP